MLRRNDFVVTKQWSYCGNGAFTVNENKAKNSVGKAVECQDTDRYIYGTRCPNCGSRMSHRKRSFSRNNMNNVKGPSGPNPTVTANFLDNTN